MSVTPTAASSPQDVDATQQVAARYLMMVRK